MPPPPPQVSEPVYETRTVYKENTVYVPVYDDPFWNPEADGRLAGEGVGVPHASPMGAQKYDKVPHPNPTPCAIHHTPYTMFHTPYTIHHTPYTIHHVPYTTHHTPDTRHQTPDTRHVDVGLPGKGNSNSNGARPVHQIISMIKWIRTSRLSIKNSLSKSN